MKIAKNNNRFMALIDCRMAYLGLNYGKLAKIMGMTVSTLRTKRYAPDRFTLGETQKLFTVLKFSDEEEKEALYGG